MVEAYVPSREEMMNPLLEALKRLGGSGTVREIETEVAEIMSLSDEQLDVIHSEATGARTEFSYRLAWTRTYLKKAGLIDNSRRAVWSLTVLGKQTDYVDEREIANFVRQMRSEADSSSPDVDDEPEDVLTWENELLETLLQLEPDAFERLVQQMLRESGFTQVEVIGRSGDGGIDGVGVLQLNGLISFKVLFQAKRWKGSVGAPVVRDFRGAMVGRADKGLLVTTSSFTQEAQREATRDGADAIDLVDGESLVNKLKELSLGVHTELVEKVTIDKSWFQSV